MNLEDLYRILGIDASSTEEERFRAYKELRERLDAKLSKAPTSGLKEKYAQAFKQLDEAIEIVESRFDEKELSIFNVAPSVPDELPSEGAGEILLPADPGERSKRSLFLWMGLGAMVVIVLLLVSIITWRRHIENEEQRIAAVELARAQEIEKAELALALQEIDPLIEQYKLFSTKLETTLKNAEARSDELETAKGVAKREKGRSEQELSSFRFEKHAEYVNWLREYLDENSVVGALNTAEKYVSEGNVDAAKNVLKTPLPDFDKLLATIEGSKQEKYDFPLRDCPISPN